MKFSIKTETHTQGYPTYGNVTKSRDAENEGLKKKFI